MHHRDDVVGANLIGPGRTDGLVAVAHIANPLPSQAEYFFRLAFGRHLEVGAARQGWNLDRAAQHHGGKIHRHFAVQVIAIPLKYLVGLDANLYIDIPRAGTGGVAFPFPQPNLVAFVDAGGNFHRQSFLVAHHAPPIARHTRVGNDAALAAVLRVGLLNRKETLLHPHLTVAVAGGASPGLGAGTRARAFASGAVDRFWHPNLLVDTVNRFLPVNSRV